MDEQPFFSFSAACMEFGRNLLEMLGENAPPIGLIQSAVREHSNRARSAVERDRERQRETERERQRERGGERGGGAYREGAALM